MASVLSQKENQTGIRRPVCEASCHHSLHLSTREGCLFHQIGKAHHCQPLLGLSRDPKWQQKPKCIANSESLQGRPQSPWLVHSPCGTPFHSPETHPEDKINNVLALGNKTCLLGTPDTSRSGRNTRKARRALTSKPPDLPLEWLPPSVSLVNCSKITLNNLKEEEGKKC